MAFWFLILPVVGLTTIIASILLGRSRSRRDDKKLPPGPSLLFSNLLFLTNSLPGLQSIIKYLKSKYGPIITLSIGTHPFIFVGSCSLSHQALIQKGTIFSDRPKTWRIGGISSAAYGPAWRVLRHNFTSTFLHPSNIRSYSLARNWVLGTMIAQLQEQQQAVGTVKVVDCIQLAMLRLSVLMCFGEKLDDRRVNDISRVQDGLLTLAGSLIFNAFLVTRRLAKTLFRNKWNKFDQLRKEQKQQLISLIDSRTKVLETPKTINLQKDDQVEQLVAYIDTLLKLEVPVDDQEATKTKLTQKEMVSTCGEFLLVATETTSSALQWILANLVKHPCIQSKLYDDIVAVVGPPPPPGIELEKVINEENLHKIPYLKAVILEGLRRHPPAHILLPHRVGEEVELQGYTIPKGATINFMVAEMGWDPEIWDDPMVFKPERFLSNDGTTCVFDHHVDVAGIKGIKMMPFGAGRRICPGADLALLHLEYFIANLIWYFQWSVPDGYNQVDLGENFKFTVVMKNPLQAKITARTQITTTT